MTSPSVVPLGPLNLIVVEDSATDVELEVDALREAGLTVDVRPVDTEFALRAALDERLPDAILSDWTLPDFSGRRSLDIARERCPEVPFIFVSGTISDAAALEGMKRGAVDYVYKHQLQHLGQVLTRALEENHMQSALRQSEKKYRRLFETSRDALMLLRPPSWCFDDANQTALQLFGVTSMAEWTGLGPWDVAPERQPDGCLSGEKILEMIETALREGSHFFEWELRRLTGETFAADVLLTRVDAEDGFWVQATVRDITERKHGEQRLRVKNLVFDVSLAANSIANLDGVLTEANDAFLRTWGYQSKDEVLGRQLAEFFVDPNETIAIMRALGDANRWEGNFAGRRKDGSTFVALGLATPLLDSGGKTIGYQSAVLDITLSEQTKRDLAHSALKVSERAKELNCLFQVSKIGLDPRLSLAEALQNTVRVIPPGWFYPESACARIVLEERAYTTDNYRETPWKLAADITRAGRKVGTVEVSYLDEKPESDEGPFLKEERSLIDELARTVGAAVERKQAEVALRDYLVRLERAVSGTVGAVSKMMDMRDPYTSGHETRVGEISAAIAAEMGLDAERQKGLRVAGSIHDVGKITVPAEILSKPGKLSAIEYSLIQQHAQQGYEVLKDIDFPWPVAEVARQHHERIDGTGYPRGLKGEAILLEARILAVADVVESMVSHRPYRAGLGIDKALAEIERGRGTAYDSAVADACLKLFREKGYVIPA